MRFNEKRTCLEFLEGRMSDNIQINKMNWDDDRKKEMRSDIKKAFSNTSLMYQFGNEVRYMTRPFYDAYEIAKPKIREIILTEPLGKVSGTLIWRIDKDRTKTIFYHIDQDDISSFNLIMFSFVRGFEKTALDYCIQYWPTEDKKEMDIQYCIGDPYEVAGIKESDITVDFILLLTFIKYCDIETKVLQPKKKLREFGVHYYNETKQTIKVLDSTWFTNLVKSDGFKVRGHFRLQPYGTGMSRKKWIWINDFTKDGYASQAKKL